MVVVQPKGDSDGQARAKLLALAGSLGDADVFVAAMDRGLLVCYAQEKILRLAPPLAIADDLLEKGVGMLIDLLKAQ